MAPNDWFASGNNLSYTTDPGFVDTTQRDYRLQSDAQLPKDLPEFQPIPFDKRGLFVDEYSKRVPTDEEARRIRNAGGSDALGTEIGVRNQ